MTSGQRCLSAPDSRALPGLAVAVMRNRITSLLRSQRGLALVVVLWLLVLLSLMAASLYIE